MKVGDKVLYNYVNFAGISDDTIATILVRRGLLTIKAKKVGQTFMWIIPMPPGKGRPSPDAMASAVGSGTQRRISLHVTPN